MSRFQLLAPQITKLMQNFLVCFLYLHNGTLSGNVKKDKPILIMEDKYIINEDGLLYKVDVPHQKTLASLKPMNKRLFVPLNFCHDMISYDNECV